MTAISSQGSYSSAKFNDKRYALKVKHTSCILCLGQYKGLDILAEHEIQTSCAYLKIS